MKEMKFDEVIKMYEEAHKRFHGTIVFKDKLNFNEPFWKLDEAEIERILKTKA